MMVPRGSAEGTQCLQWWFSLSGGLLLNRIVHPIDPRAGQTQWLVWISHHADVEQPGNLVSRYRFAGWWLLGYAIVLVIRSTLAARAAGNDVGWVWYLDGNHCWAGITLVFVTGWIYARRLAHGFAKEDLTGSP